MLIYTLKPSVQYNVFSVSSDVVCIPVICQTKSVKGHHLHLLNRCIISYIMYKKLVKSRKEDKKLMKLYNGIQLRKRML